MKKLIKGLFKLFFMFIVILGIVFGVAYKFRRTTAPVENFVQSRIKPYIIPDTTGQGAAMLDTLLTPYEEMGEQIRERMAELDTKDLTLQALEDSLTEKGINLAAERTSLEQLQTTLTSDVGDRIDELAKLTEAMKPQQAAQILLGLPDQSVVEILNKMKPKKAGKIIEVFDPVRAADILKKYKKLSIKENQ